MATGDQNDILARLQKLSPLGWFIEGLADIRDALLAGLAIGIAYIYTALEYVRLQTRISTATGGWLDMIAGDFLGDTLPRATNQSDASYRARVLAVIFRERCTRGALSQVLQQLTGRTPWIFEAARPADTSGYGLACGYGVAGVASVAPYGVPGGPIGGGYGVGSLEYASMDQVRGQVRDSDIYAAINSVRPVGYTVWARISD